MSECKLPMRSESPRSILIGMKLAACVLLCLVGLCLLGGGPCLAQEHPGNLEVAKDATAENDHPIDPITVHPLFGAAVPPGVYVPMTDSQRGRLFIRQTFTTANPFLRTAISSGISQLQGRQYSWGGGVEGYSRRYASQYGTYVIRNSFLSLGAWGLGHDTRYVPSKTHNVGARIGHAVLQNFLTVNREGKTTVHLSRIFSGYAAGMIATNWQPKSKW